MKTRTTSSDQTGPHSLERNVQRELLSQKDMRFSSLVVRRVKTGICLEGVMHATEDDCDSIEALVRRVAGVNDVLNHLVVQPESPVE